MKHKLVLITCILALATITACGFKPVYAQHQNTGLSDIYINEIGSREGQILRSQLQDMLGSSGNNYILDISLDKKRRQFSIQEDFRVSRFDIVLTGHYTLKSNFDGQVLIEDKAIVYSSYNRTISEFSTYTAEQDATEEAAEELAYEIRNRIAAYFSR